MDCYGNDQLVLPMPDPISVWTPELEKRRKDSVVAKNIQPVGRVRIAGKSENETPPDSEWFIDPRGKAVKPIEIIAEAPNTMRAL